MHIVKLDATDSTNQYLKELWLSKELADFTVVTTRAQLKGKGQRGAIWQSEPDKNLTISVLKKFGRLPISDQFVLTICVSLAILNTLSELAIPALRVKWPNDIMSGNSKLCGILIENVLSGSEVKASIIGIGLNVNQQSFNTLSNATSLNLLLGRSVNLEVLMHKIVAQLKDVFHTLETTDGKELWSAYESNLFRKDRPSTFKGQDQELFMGIIRTISPEGKLVVELENAIFKEYDLKEVQLMY